MKNKPLQKALFLDRDGVINIDNAYVHKIEDFKFIQDIFPLLKIFIKHNYLIFVVTNQSGIGRGYYTKNDFEKLTSWMIKTFNAKAIPIESIQFCPHVPEENCRCRKPKTGMVDALLSTYNIDLKQSWLIGDKQSDIDLAHHASIGHTIAIGTRDILRSDYHFKTIQHCKEYIDENQGKIL